MKPTTLYIAAGVAGLVAVIYLARKAGNLAGAAGSMASKAAAAAVDALNPASATNVVNRAANSVFGVAADVARGDPLGTNVDSIGTWLYGLFGANRDAGAIATAPTPAPRTPTLIKSGDYFATVDRDDAQMFRAVNLPVDLGEYADTLAMDDAAAGAWLSGFRVDGTAPAFINYSAAFPSKRFQ